MIFRYDDQPNQPGYWFLVRMDKADIRALRHWLKENFGRPTPMVGHLTTGWSACHPDRLWTIIASHKFNGGHVLAIWTQHAASLFLTFHEVKPITELPYRHLTGIDVNYWMSHLNDCGDPP